SHVFCTGRQCTSQLYRGCFGKETTRASAGDQTRALSRLAAVRDTVNANEASGAPGRRWLGRSNSVSNRSERSGTARNDTDRNYRDWCRRRGGSAICLGDFRVVAVDPVILSCTAANHDRRPWLEPLGRNDCCTCGRTWPWCGFWYRLLARVFCRSRFPRLVARLSRNARAPSRRHQWQRSECLVV